jgi:predicted Zn-dependent protease
MADRREALHSQIATLERDIREKAAERERVIPATFEVQLAKLQLAKRWPDRREKVAADVADGHARDRKHGDVEDIGYRRLVKDPEKDIEVGEKAVRQLMSEGRLPMEIQEPAVHQYVRSLAARIVKNSDLKVPLHLTVLDSTDIHPITLPGGYLFLSSSLILTTRTESELAGVIAREIARIAARQGTSSSNVAIISKFFTPLAQVASGILTGGAASPGAYYGIGYGVQGLGTLVDRTLVGSGGKYQQEADQLGMQFAWKAGYDPRGFIAFLDSVSEDQQYSTVLTTSSPEELGERIMAAFGEFEYLPPRESYITDSPEYRSAKEQLREFAGR